LGEAGQKELIGELRERFPGMYVTFEGCAPRGGALGTEEGRVNITGLRVFHPSAVKALEKEKASFEDEAFKKAKAGAERRGEAFTADEGGDVVSQEKLEGALGISPKKGEKISIRRVGDSFFLVADTKDGIVVRSLGGDVYGQTRLAIVRANEKLSAKDEESGKKGIQEGEYVLDKDGIYSRSTGVPGEYVVKFDNIITDNVPEKEVIERLPMPLKEAPGPAILTGGVIGIPRYLGTSILSLLRGLRDSIGDAWDWLIERHQLVQSRFVTSWRNVSGIGSGLIFGLWLLRRALGIPMDILKFIFHDTKRRFAVLGEWINARYNRAMSEMEQRWKREDPKYQLRVYRLEAVAKDKDASWASKALANVRLWWLGRRLGRWKGTGWHIALRAYQGALLAARAAQGVLWLGKKAVQLVTYGWFYWPWSALDKRLKARRARREVEPKPEEVVNIRLPDTLRTPGKPSEKAEEITDLAESLTGERLSGVEKTGLLDKLREYLEAEGEYRYALGFGDVGGIANILADMYFYEVNKKPEHKDSAARLGRTLFGLHEKEAKAAKEDEKNEIQKKKAERARILAQNYIALASALDKKDIDVKTLRAVTLYAAGDKEGAKKILDKIKLGNIPDRDVRRMAYATMAKMLEDEKDYNRAAGMIQKAKGLTEEDKVTVAGEEIELSVKKQGELKKQASEKKEEKVSLLNRVKRLLFPEAGASKKQKAIGFGIFVGLFLLAILAPQFLPLVYLGFTAPPVVTGIWSLVAISAPVFYNKLLVQLAMWVFKYAASRVRNWTTNNFTLGRMLAREISAQKRAPEKAEPRIKLVKAYEEAGEQKKAEKLIKKTMRMIRKDRMSPEEAAKFIEYLLEKGKVDEAKELFIRIYPRVPVDKVPVPLLILRAKMALRDEPLDPVKMAGEPEDPIEIAAASADGVLSREPENAEALLLKGEALAKRFEKEEKKDKKTPGEFNDILAKLTELTERGLLTPEQERRASEMEIAKAVKPEDSDRAVWKKAKETKVGEAVPEKPKMAEEPAKPETHKPAMEDLEKLKKEKKLSPSDRLALAVLYMENKDWRKALNLLRAMPQDAPEKAEALKRMAMCCYRMLEDPKWWYLTLITRLRMTSAINGLRSIKGQEEWADWIESTIKGFDISKAKAASEKRSYTPKPEDKELTGEQGLNNELFTLGVERAIASKKDEIDTVNWVGGILSEAQIPEAEKGKMRANLDKKKSAAASKELLRDIQKEKKAKYVMVSDLRKLRNRKRRALSADEKMSLGRQIEETEKDISDKRARILKMYTELINQNAGRPEVIEQVRREMASEIGEIAGMMKKEEDFTPERFTSIILSLDDRVLVEDLSEGGRDAYALFLENWTEYMGQKLGMSYEKDKVPAELEVGKMDVFTQQVTMLLLMYPGADENLKRQIEKILKEISGFKLFGNWDKEEKEYTRKPIFDVIASMIRRKDIPSLRFLWAGLQIAEAGKISKDDLKENLKDRADAALLLNAPLTSLKSKVVDPKQDVREKAFNLLLSIVNFWFGDGADRAVDELLAEIISKETLTPDDISRIQRVLAQVRLMPVMYDNQRQFIEYLVGLKEVPLNKKLEAIDKCGLSPREKLEVLISLMEKEKFTGDDLYIALDNLKKRTGEVEPQDLKDLENSLTRLLEALPPDRDALVKGIEVINVISSKATKEIPIAHKGVFETLRPRLEKVMLEEMKKSEKAEVGLMLEEIERQEAIAARLGEMGEYGQAQKILEKAIERLNDVLKKNMELARKGEELYAKDQVLRLVDKVNVLTGKVTEFYRRQGKHYEAEILVVRGYRLLAEYGIIVEGLADVSEYTQKAEEALVNANMLNPYQPEVALEMMRIKALSLRVARRELEESEK
ncbi:MAG: hypothetical protein WBC00_08270, partial [Candidatus Omnitrophota bacterium]